VRHLHSSGGCSVDLHYLAGEVLDKLSKSGRTLSTAESCTGGLVACELTNHPGASQVFLGGFITYSNELKTELLNVDDALLREFGAVDERVAVEMAEGACKATGSDYAISTTGIAGPSGGTPEKPIGLVYIGVAGPSGSFSQKLELSGDRMTIRSASSEALFKLLLSRI